MAKKPISKITSQEPSPDREPKYDWASIAEQLQAEPNKWFLIFEQDLSSLAITIRQNAISALKKEKGFEMKTRNNTPWSPGVTPVCDLYLRYNPKKVQK